MGAGTKLVAGPGKGRAKGRVVGKVCAISHHNSPKPLLRPVNRSAGAPVSLATRTSCPFYSLFSFPPLVFSYLSNLPMLRTYQPQPKYLPFNGLISRAFFRAPQPLPSRTLRLAMITLPVPSSSSVVNPKAAFRSSGPTCALILPFLLFYPQVSIVLSSVSTSTPSPGPLHHLKAEPPPRHHPQEVPP